MGVVLELQAQDDGINLQSVQGLSGKYPAILNISRTGRMALM